MKKILAFLLTTVMVVSLAACGGTKESQSTSNETEDSTQTSATEENQEDGSNSLTVWCWNPAFNIYAMEEAAKVYQQDHPDFELNVVETPWPDIQTKLTTAATSGNYSVLPDIVLMQDNAFQKNILSFPEVFTDLTNSGIDFNQFGAAKTAYSVADGKNYGVPFDNGAVISCLRTDILEEAGYTVDDFTDITWTKYIEMGKDILEKTGKPLLSCQAGESDLIMIILQSAGASLFDENGNPTIVDNDVLLKAFDIYKELVTSGVMIEVNDWDQYIGTLNNDTVAGTINGCWILGSIQAAQDQSGKWTVTNMPLLEGVSNASNYSNNGGSSWLVTSNCKNTELAEDFLNSTFAASVSFYETILPSSGAMATYLPAGESDVYAEPQEFFGGEPIYSLITEFAGKIPSNNTGVYYYEARDAVATALVNTLDGADQKSEIKNAEDTVKFQMGQ